MDVSKAEHEGSEPITATGAGALPEPAGRPSSAAIRKTLIVGVLLALLGACVASVVSEQIRTNENVETQSVTRGVKWTSTRFSAETAARNAAVAYGLLGAILASGLGVTSGRLLGRLSTPRAAIAGLAGLVLGGALGAGLSYGLTPLYFHRLETADVTLAVLIHLGIWTAVGAASGIAFALGSGSRKLFAGSIMGGIIGAALAAVLFDCGGAMLPLARTERPLSEEALTRFVATIVLALFTVAGIVIVAFQKPRAAVKSL